MATAGISVREPNESIRYPHRNSVLDYPNKRVCPFIGNSDAISSKTLSHQINSILDAQIPNQDINNQMIHATLTYNRRIIETLQGESKDKLILDLLEENQLLVKSQVEELKDETSLDLMIIPIICVFKGGGQKWCDARQLKVFLEKNEPETIVKDSVTKEAFTSVILNVIQLRKVHSLLKSLCLKLGISTEIEEMIDLKSDPSGGWDFKEALKLIQDLKTTLRYKSLYYPAGKEQICRFFNTRSKALLLAEKLESLNVISTESIEIIFKESREDTVYSKMVYEAYRMSKKVRDSLDLMRRAVLELTTALKVNWDATGAVSLIYLLESGTLKPLSDKHGIGVIMMYFDNYEKTVALANRLYQKKAIKEDCFIRLLFKSSENEYDYSDALMRSYYFNSAVNHNLRPLIDAIKFVTQAFVDFEG